MKQWIVVISYQCFRAIYCSQLQGLNPWRLPLGQVLEGGIDNRDLSTVHICCTASSTEKNASSCVTISRNVWCVLNPLRQTHVSYFIPRYVGIPTHPTCHNHSLPLEYAKRTFNNVKRSQYEPLLLSLAHLLGMSTFLSLRTFHWADNTAEIFR